jgi:hypothetical protein
MLEISLVEISTPFWLNLGQKFQVIFKIFAEFHSFVDKKYTFL